MAKSQKNKNKPKLNLTVRDEQRNKLEQMASLENRSVSNLIEVMADERWKQFVICEFSHPFHLGSGDSRGLNGISKSQVTGR